MKRRGKTLARLRTGLGKLLLRTSSATAGMAARLLAGDPSVEAQGWKKFAEAILAWRRGDHHEALELMRAAAQSLPEEPTVVLSLALAFANADQWDIAVDAGERAMKFFPEVADQPQLWQMLAWGYLITGRYRAVIELMQRMQQADVSIAHIELPLVLARAMVWQQEPEVAQLRLMVKRTRSQLPAYLRFVEHLARAGHDRVGLLLLAALPPPAALHAMDVMARRAAARGDIAAAVWAANALQQLEIAPDVSRAMAAVAAVMAGDAEQAQRYVSEACQLGPDQPLVQERAAVVYLVLGNEEKALSCATRAVMAGSSDALCAGLVASALADKGAMAEARRVFATRRVGDAVGALVGHLVQAQLFAEQDKVEDVRRLLELATAEMQDVPRWARAKALGKMVVATVGKIQRAVEIDEELGEALSSMEHWGATLAAANSAREADAAGDVST